MEADPLLRYVSGSLYRDGSILCTAWVPFAEEKYIRDLEFSSLLENDSAESVIRSFQERSEAELITKFRLVGWNNKLFKGNRVKRNFIRRNMALEAMNLTEQRIS